MKLIVDNSFWEIFPDVTIAVMVLRNIDNKNANSVPQDILKHANEKALELVPNDPISENEVIKSWREAFSKFKTKKGNRSAVENLLKRVKNGNPVSSINPLVDIYNSVSLESGFPIGALDIDKVVGDIHLTVANGGENFQPIGETEYQQALPGEVIYKDQKEVTSRHWVWRDSARTQVDANTKNVVFYMENLKPEWNEKHQSAINTLKERFDEYLGSKLEVQMISKENPFVEFK